MNSGESHLILNRHISKKCFFAGVYCRDNIPQIHFPHYPACLVSNTDTNNQPGKHWVAFYYQNPFQCEFFDSYGLAPQVFGFTIHANIVNQQPLQDLESSVCGQYCI